MILPLIYYGNGLLRTRSEKVEHVDQEIKQLCLDMIETMDANNGIGLAAIQVGRPLRIITIRALLEDEDGNSYLDEPEVFINPVLSNPNTETEVLAEGCLSIPKLHYDVERPISIHVDALDIEGKKFSKEIIGFKAREIMHENDHLNGVLFIDRLLARKRKEIEPLLREIKEKYNN